ncbi:MAG: AzlC family ABC transporter permease [Micromonosporaceae bacterium]
MGRTVDADLVRDVSALAAATALVGASFGAIAVAAGISPWWAVALSIFVFAGAAQFAAVAVIASGGSPYAAVLAGLVLNVRHVPLGLAVGDVLGRGWLSRLVGSHLLVDESVAFTIAQSDPRRRRLAYWTTGIGLFIAWNLGVAVGGFAGRTIGDPAALGLDAAFPAALVALLLPSLREPGPRRVALLAVVIALTTTPFLPSGLPVLLALAAVLVGLLPAGRARDEEGTA